jgi:hypothetical protein
MTKIDYEALDEQYDTLPRNTPIRGNTNPVGSLTDNRREVKANRDGAIKRLRAIKEASYV